MEKEIITIKDTCYRGTRILLGNSKRDIINKMITKLRELGFKEIQIPIINFQKYFQSKVGEENNNMMFNFIDRGDRELCLAPEYTAIVQELSNTYFKYDKDVFVFYVLECFRGERPQAGRYRQFTQLGVEIINPTIDYKEKLINIATELIGEVIDIEDISINENATRGLDYYKSGKGFEISYNKLGSSSQICGGGEYIGGVGFAIGVDRLL